MAAILVITSGVPCLLLAALKLHTQLAADGVRVRFAPIQSEWRFIPWAQVRRAYTRTYAPLREYGGWGIRTFMGENEAYNAWGNQGLQLVLLSGERLLIGTQQPMAVNQVLSDLQVRDAESDIAD